MHVPSKPEPVQRRNKVPGSDVQRREALSSEGQRREALKGGLLQTVSLLKSRRASEIAPGTIDDYVALDWLEWNGGTLRLTVIGDNIRKQLTSGVA